MSAPAWFDKDVYLANKLDQLQSTEPNNGWVMLKMLEAFNNAGFDPFTDDGIYAHFVAYGNAENVSPNPYFDVDTYFANKLAQLQATEPDNGWTSVDQVKEAFAADGLSAWDHYTLYGAAEGVSPSIFFNTEDYMNAKLAQMQADDPAYTMTQLEQAFKDADLNPIEHYLLYGKNENLNYTPYSPDGGYAPLPKTGIAVAEVTDTTEPGYILEDSVDNLVKADYSVINNAKSVTVVDSIAGFTGANAANTAKVLAFADNVVVEDSLSNMAQNVLNGTLPSFGTTPTSLLVTGATATATAINLGTVSVAVAADGQNLLDVFLARTDVYYENGQKPTELTLGTYSIEDTAANVLAAASTLLESAADVTVADTVANVTANLASIEGNDNVSAITVTDTLSNISSMSNGMMTGLVAEDGISFVATDEGNATVTYSAALATMAGKNITIDASAADAVTLNASAQTEALTSMDLNKYFSSDDDTTFSFIGTKGGDTITAHANGGTIDGGLGQDTINLGAGNDTVVLGSGITKVEDLASTASNDDTIASFGSQGSDKIDFAGMLDGFGSDDFIAATGASASGGSNNVLNDGNLVIFTGTDASATGDVSGLFASASNDDKYLSLGEGDSIILITDNGSKSYVWYVENSDGKAGVSGDEVHLVATLSDVTDASKLTADNFA